MSEKKLVNKKSWKEFRETGLLWWINTTLHMFGWAIVFEIEDETGDVIQVYPARVRYRGFNEENNTLGYQKVTQYLNDNINELLEESND